MRSLLTQLLCLLFLLFAFACNNPEKMKDMASGIQITAAPSVLEVKADNIQVTLTVTFPPKFFNKKGVLEMMPVLKSSDGTEIALEPKMLKGEEVTENYDVIPFEAGGNYSQSLKIPYADNLRQATLYIRPTLIVKGKRIPFPADLKAADGVNATVKLVEKADGFKVMFLEDEYVMSTKEEKEAQIMYLINRSDVRGKELKSQTVQEFNQFIIDAEKNKALSKVAISAYASPDGPEKLNDRLSANRGKSSNKIISDLFKKNKIRVSPEMIEVMHITEDWEGFKDLMQNSNIQDKDLVLRILSMYNDPAVREKEIKNLAKVYKQIADEILPLLRRAKMIAEVEIKNLNEEQIRERVDASNLESLDIEQLLYCKKLYNDETVLIKIFEFAANKFSDYRAYNNLGALLLQSGDAVNAKVALETAEGLNGREAAIKNNLGHALLFNGDEEAGLKLLSESGTEESQIGLALNFIKSGDYSRAGSLLNGVGSFNEALVRVLSADLDGATKVLSKLKTAKSYYLRAIVAARRGNETEVIENLQKCWEREAQWKNYVKSDIEFAAFLPKLGL